MKKTDTQIIKGIAICMMVIHHIFMEEWHISSAPDVPCYLSVIAHTCKICVAIYCFLSGYGYAFAKSKNLHYSMVKCVSLLKQYWLQLFLIFIPVAVINGYELTPQRLVRNMFGLTPNLNWFAWYVYFYIFSMLMLPACTNCKMLWKKPWIGPLCIIVASYSMGVLLHGLSAYGENVLVTDLFNCAIYFPGVILGYACAKYHVFEWLDSKLPDCFGLNAIAAVTVLLCRTIICSFISLPLDVYFAPVFVYFCNRLFSHNKMNFIGKVLSVYGSYSTQIWFFHAIFFSSYFGDYCQWILWLPRNPLLVFIWCMMLCLMAAIPLGWLADGIDQLETHVIRKMRNA